MMHWVAHQKKDYFNTLNPDFNHGYGICFSNRTSRQLRHLMRNNAFGLMNVNGVLER